MENKTKKVKWTKKFKALFISISLALAVALGGACAAIGIAVAGRNERLGGSFADNTAGTSDLTPDETFSTGVEIDGVTYTTNAEAWAAAVKYSVTEEKIVQFNLTRSWTATADTNGFATEAAKEINSDAFGVAGSLNVPEGATVILNIKKNMRLDRNLASVEAIENGEVISLVGGSLIIQGDGVVTGGNTSGYGGGIIVNNGSLFLYGGSISHNVANRGGGVYLSGGTFEMNGGEIANNSVARYGGGVYNNGTFKMLSGRITKNTVSNNSGGGVFSGGTLEMNGGEISDNTAGANGGGVYANSGTFTMSSGTISDNTANSGGGIYSNVAITLNGGTVSGNRAKVNGGGIYSVAAGENNDDGTLKTAGLTINDGTISNNTANRAGGVYIHTGATLTMTGGEISGNTANISGGGVFVTDNATFTMGVKAEDGTLSGAGVISGNNAGKNKVDEDGDGGGVYISGGTFTLNSGDIINNTSFDDAAGLMVYHGDFIMNGGNVSNNTTHEWGGGVAFDGLSSSHWVMSGGTISGNKALGGAGVHLNCGLFTMSGGEISGNTATGSGGGVFVESAVTLTINGGTVSDNKATENGGGIYSIGDIIINNGTISGNTANHGGGIRIGNANSATCTINGGTIDGNTALYGGGVTVSAYGKLNASNVIETYGLTINGGTISNNKSTSLVLPMRSDYGGGGIYVVNGSTFAMYGGTISGNEAASNGGGILFGDTYKTAVNNAHLFFEKDKENNPLIIKDNVAEGNGGGLFFYQGNAVEVSVTGGTISGNTSHGSGGGVYVNSNGTLTVAESHVINNTAIENGGGVYNEGTTSLTNTTITDNTSVDGGGIYNTSKLDLTGVTITGNEALNDGGGIYEHGRLSIRESNKVTIKGNSSGQLTNNLYFCNSAALGLYSGGVNVEIGVSVEVAGTTFIKGCTVVLPINNDGSETGYFPDLPNNYEIKETITNGKYYYSLNSKITGSNAERWKAAVAASLANNGAQQLFELTEDWTATAGNGFGADATAFNNGGLLVPAGADIVLDLKSFTLNRNGSSKVIYLRGGKLTIKGSGTIKGGRASEMGGAILVEGGELILNGGTITDCIASIDGGNGGAVYIDGSSSFTMNGGTISNNTAGGNGGGVYVAEGGTFTMKGGTIGGSTENKNTAVQGGGVWVAGGTFNMTAGTISYNQGTNIDGFGGVGVDGGTFNLSGGSINNNVAEGKAGICVFNGGTFRMTGGNVVDNVTSRNDCGGSGVQLLGNGTVGTFTGGLISGNKTLGGAIKVSSGAVCNIGESVEVDGKTVYRGNVRIVNNASMIYTYANPTMWGGGGIYATDKGTVNIYSGEISGNTAQNGGGILINGSTVNMYGGVIYGNAASYGESTTTEVSKGGGVYVYSGTFNMYGGTISGNTAPQGGAVYIASGSFNMEGGEIIGGSYTRTCVVVMGEFSAEAGATGSLTNVRFNMSGGKIVVNGDVGTTATNWQGGVQINEGTFTMSDTAVITATDNNSSVGSSTGVRAGESNNTLNDYCKFVMNGGEITGFNLLGTYVGGGVWVAGGTFEMNGGKIHGNTASNGGGVCVGGGTFNMTGGTISGNTATGNGGGVYVDAGATFNMGTVSGEGSNAIHSGSGVISGNTAKMGNGGAIYLNGSTVNGASTASYLYLHGGTISGNEATYDTADGAYAKGRGGAVYVETHAAFVMYNGTISENRGSLGGGVFVYERANFTLLDGNIIKNNALTGGGLDICSGVALHISGGTISENTARNGGGLYVQSIKDNSTITGVVISANTATANGGGIHIGGGTFTMENGTISGNTANGHGGGVYYASSSATFTMSNGEIFGNEATQNGGGIYVCSGNTFELSNGKIYENTSNSGAGVHMASDNGTTASTFNMTGGEIYSNTSLATAENSGGGGVFLGGHATLNMSGEAKIYNNGTSGQGGGVFVWGALNIQDTATISGNSSLSGGGVYVLGSFTMTAGTISDNEVTQNGGGVLVAANGTFTMSGGTIGENTANNAGGGVYVSINGTFAMSGGTISNNAGGGVYVNGTFNMTNGTISGNTGRGVTVDNGTFTLGSGSKKIISENTDSDGAICNVYLPAGKKINIGSQLGRSDRIGVTSASGVPVTITSNYGSVMTGDLAEGRARMVFSADKEGEIVVYEKNEIVLKQGVVLTINDDNGNKLGSITTESGANVSGRFNETTRIYRLSEVGASGNVVNFTFNSDYIPEGYAAYMYAYGDVNKTEISEFTMGNSAATVCIAKKALDRDYTIHYYLQNVDGSYGTTFITGTHKAPTDSAVVVVDSDGKPFSTQITTPEQYSVDSARGNWQTATVAGDGSTVVEVYLKLGQYKVSFTENGTTLLASRDYFYGSKITADPADASGIKVLGVDNPTKALNTFVGWYLDKECTQPLFANGEVTVVSDLTVYAKYDTQKFNLTFNLNLGSGENQLNLDNVLAHKGATLQIVDSTLGGKVAWEHERLFNDSFAFTDTSNGTYRITYDVNNVSRFGLSLSGITPRAIGYRFLGWFDGDSRRTVINQPTNPDAQPITLTARWALEDYTITLNKMERGTAAASSTQTVEAGNLNNWSGILPAAPSRADGYVFLGWYRTEEDAKNAATDEGVRNIYFWSTNKGSDETLWAETAQFSIRDFGYESFNQFDKYGDGSVENPYNFSNLTLYAGWKSIDVNIRTGSIANGTLSFNFYNNNTVGGQIRPNATAVEIGNTIQVTATPAAGYVLQSVTVGSSTLRPSKTEPNIVRFTVNNRYLQQDPDNADKQFVTVSATFVEQAYSITYRYDGGTRAREDSDYSRSYTISQIAGESVKLPSMVTKLGYDFRGWKFVTVVGGEEVVVEEGYAHVMDDMSAEGDLYGADMWLASPESVYGGFDNVILIAQWEEQPSHVYMYNAAYELLNDDPRVSDYNYSQTENRYELNSLGGTEVIKTGMTVEIVNPRRASFTFIGWGTSSNGVVVYPVEYDEDGNIKDTISYKVEAHADRTGNELDRNKLYAIWQVAGVDYIVMNAVNNNSTYGGDGITITARPAQTYEADDNESITITYTWYRVFESQYDNCFIKKPFVENGYMLYIDENSNVVAYRRETDNAFFGVTADGGVDTDNQLTEAPAGSTMITYNEFDPASVGTACELMFQTPVNITNKTEKTSNSITIKDVNDCGTYICDVRVNASVGGSRVTFAGGYGEIEITMNKASFGDYLSLENASVQYDSTSKAETIKLGVSGGVTYNYETGYLTLPDTVDRNGRTRQGSTLIVTYKFYKVDNGGRVEITDLNEVKNAGNYEVEVSFEFLSGGDNGNYELLEPLTATLEITPRTIGRLDPAFMHNGTEVEMEAPFHATYDGDAYSVEVAILDRIELVGGSVVEVAKDGVSLSTSVFKETVNGWRALGAGELTADAGNYYLEITGLKGSGAPNYELGSMNTLRYAYTIDKKSYDVEIGWVGDKTVTFDNLAHTLKVEEDKVPDTVNIVYSTVYTPETAGYAPTYGTNGGVEAGTYAVTAKFNFKDAAAANNYEKLPDMTETLTIEKVDLLEYFRNSPNHNEDLLVGGNFVNASYAYKTGEKHNPHVESGSLTNDTNFTLTYEYYLLSSDGSGRTLIGSGKHEDLVNAGNLISEAGTYEVVLRIAYANARYSNNFKEVEEEQSTITCLIEEGTVDSVTVNWKTDAAAWKSGVAKSVNLGDGFDFNWIESIDVMYVGSSEPKTITGDAIKLAVVSFDPDDGSKILHTNFWHVGAFNLEVSYYGTASSNAFTVYQAIENKDVTLQYCIAGGAYDDVPDDGIVFRAENDYSFRIRYSGTGVNGNVISEIYTNLAIKDNDGKLVLGANALTPRANAGETLYYTFGDISVNVYKVVALSDITWKYRVKGAGEWSNLNKSTLSIDYAGAEFEVIASFAGDGSDGAQEVKATLDEGLVLRNYRANGYTLKFGATDNGKYLVTDDLVVHIAKLELTLKWNTDSLEYNGGRALAPAVVAPAEGNFITASDMGLVTFKYSFAVKDGNGVESMSNVGSYVVTAELDGDEELKNNYVIIENAENEFAITPAQINMSVTYSESTYGVNRTYEGNRELRIPALQKNFNGGTAVGGEFKFITGLAENYSESLVIDGKTLAETVLAVSLGENENSRTETIYYAYIPESGNYKVTMGSITLTVLKQTARTGAGSLSIVLGENASKVYLKGQTVNTTGIYVYRLYQSAYREGNTWYGKIEDVTNKTPKPTFRVGDWDADQYTVRESDAVREYITLKAIVGSDSGTIDIPVADRIPESIEITPDVEFKNTYYVGEKFDFSDIDFTVSFPGDDAQSGFKYGSIRSDIGDYTDVDGKFTTAGTITVTFTYIDVSCQAEFEILARDTLTVELPANRRTLVLKDGAVVGQPQLTFKLADGTVITPEGVAYTIEVFRGEMSLGDGLSVIETVGDYELVFKFDVTNPRFNNIGNYSVFVKVTENPYSAKVTLPTELNPKYTGNAITIPMPSVTDVINSADGSTVTRYTVVYKINGEEVTDNDAWKKTLRGRYEVTFEVRIDGTDFSAILNEYGYTFVIGQADNTAEIEVPELVILDVNAKFDFDVTATFGADTVVYEYWNAATGWQSEAPDRAGIWKVRATIPEEAENQNYKEVVLEHEFEVRAADIKVNDGSVEGGNGIGEGWTLEIKQMAEEDVSQVAINRQNVLDGYTVELKNGSDLVSDQGEYTVRVKLSEELSGRTDLKVFFKDAEGNTSEKSARVVDGYVEFTTSEFGTFIITSQVAGAPVGLLVAVIILAVVAAGMITACIIVFVKKKKKGAQ